MREDFLLSNPTAEELYHSYAAPMPIIDYHNHLPPQDMAEDRMVENITQVWLNGDHYKWRAMRANGIPEEYITGNRTDPEKFEKWAQTVPYTLRNPLYHWTHLELRRYFDIELLLDGQSAASIYEKTGELLRQKEFSTRGLLERMNVRVVCTTDDPVDDLRFHEQISRDDWAVKVYPAFRPDKAMQVDDPVLFNKYLNELEKAADTSIGNFNDFISALKKRHDYFADHGCRISDHGLEQIYAEEYTEKEIQSIFSRIRTGSSLTAEENLKFKSAMLVYFAEWDHEKGWVQQYHLGALRNNNTRMLKNLGPDTGWDSIGDFPQARTLSRFLDRLDRKDQLTRTILYNLNPSDNEVFAAMIGNFNDGSVAGKIQWGSAWWFLDQKEGMTRQLNTLSNMGLLSKFIGMLTDSRSFLSFPRHEYFRRILCDLLGREVENGELPHDIPWIGQIVQDICFNNAKEYFGFEAARGER